MSARVCVTELKEYWYIAAASRELGREPLARTLLGRPLVLFRQGDGGAAALEDRCAHRNAPLSCGRVRDGCLECPYHGWRYRGDGGCAEVPSLGRGVAVPDGIGVRAYPAVERDGFIWVFMGDGPPPPRGHPPPFRFPHAGERGWTSFRMRTRFRANAMACLENFLDCPHTVYVHEGWFRSRAAREVRARVVRQAGGVDVEFHEEQRPRSLVARLLFPPGREMVHTDRFLMPTTTRVDYSFGPDRHFIITSQCTPVTEEETEVHTVVCFRFGWLGGCVRLFFEPVCRRIIRQDVEILERQSEQIRRFRGPRFTMVETDLVGPPIRQVWQRALAEEPPDPSGFREEREVVLRF